MKYSKKKSAGAAELRRSAEERLRSRAAGKDLPRTETDMRQLLHELQVHEIELEMQNEELCRAQDELELSRNKYVELYDFAPAGYFIFDAQGLIREVNLAGAQLLGIERERLATTPFADFIADAEGREIFFRHLEMTLQHQGMLSCEIRLTRNEGTVIYAQLQSVSVTSDNKVKYFLTIIIDITARKQLKERLKAENIYLHQEVTRGYNFGEIIGQSTAMSYVFFRVEQVAPQDATVLLLGETGTGKGLIARAIHAKSSRRDRPMITVNCTALPANLIESELFGREKGAFTGADARQMGRFELADGGTIFLDEIGEMPLELQSKLLRVIQDGEFERLGSPRTIKVNVRIIAASNRNLEEEISNGRFREDLFYRLNVFPITIPPLRQRTEDIPLLVNYFVAKFNKKLGKKIETVSKESLNALQEYHWPGNVRELESVIERAMITSQGTALQVLDRFEPLRKTGEQSTQDVTALADLERDHILQVLQKTGWRIDGQNGAALLLGLNPSTLRARMRKYGIRKQ
jgi:PAS domain S-box-containing protein